MRKLAAGTTPCSKMSFAVRYHHLPLHLSLWENLRLDDLSLPTIYRLPLPQKWEPPDNNAKMISDRTDLNRPSFIFIFWQLVRCWHEALALVNERTPT